MKKQNNTFLKIGGYAILAAIAITTLLPFYIMIVMGTFTNEELFRGLHLSVGKNMVANFEILMKAKFLNYYRNSMVISLSATILTCLSSAMGGYAIAKYKFRFQKFMYTFILATLMIPGGLGLIAWVWEMKQFGWINTFWPFIIPAMGNSFGVFWLTQFARDSVPNDVIESARVDGSSEYRTFFTIVIPFLQPAIIALALLYFLGAWNNYMGPLVMISKPELYTMPLGIATLGSLFRVEYAARILGMTLGTIPLLILFISTSKYFIYGITAGSTKG